MTSKNDCDSSTQHSLLLSGVDDVMFVVVIHSKILLQSTDQIGINESRDAIQHQ